MSGSTSTSSSGRYSQGMVHIWGGDHSICRKVQRPHQVMNIKKRMKFGHIFRLDDAAADSHHPGIKETDMKANIQTYKHRREKGKICLCRKNQRNSCWTVSFWRLTLTGTPNVLERSSDPDFVPDTPTLSSHTLKGKKEDVNDIFYDTQVA